MKKHYILSILCCLAICGCDDDSGTSGSANCPDGNCEAAKGESCNDEIHCKSGLECKGGVCVDASCPDGNCAKEAGKGEPCGDEVHCKSGLECKQGVCVDKSEAGKGDACGDEIHCKSGLECKQGVCVDKSNEPKCSSDADCGTGNVCISKKCVPVKTLNPGDSCSSSDKTAVCPDGYDCYVGQCMTEEEYENIDKCKSDDDCVDDPNGHNKCFPSGACGSIQALNDLCDDEIEICEEGLECVLGICSERVGEGEACNDYEAVICPDDLQCIEGFCRNVVNELDKGSECNTSWKLCKKELICRDSVCIEEKGEDESCDDKYDICKNGFACLKGKCTPFGDQCESTEDCSEKDSFCCKSDECGLKGYCIPYDETTTFDNECRYRTKPGIFEAQIQCRWQPPSKDANPKSKKVEMPPLVGHFGNAKGLDSVVAFFSFNTRNTSTSADLLSVIRFIDPETCDTLESIRVPLYAQNGHYPSAADVDGDGLLELFVISDEGRPLCYKWNAEKKAHEQIWKNTDISVNGLPILFDIDGDGKTEALYGTNVLNAQTGKLIYKGSNIGVANPVVGYFDHDPAGLATLVAKNVVYKWDKTNKKWANVATLPANRTFLAYADFGTPGEKAEDFDFEHLDGYPEIASGSGGVLYLFALPRDEKGAYKTSQTIMTVNYTKPSTGSSSIQGGPITIGDFDNDGLPEIGVASTGYFGVYDPLCKQYKEGECADKNVLWERWSQDASSGVTGSSLFDFDGDGQTEAVYGDECFLRIYDGKTGKVLFSAKRSSGTSYEAPVVADIDGDGSTEIMMGSDNNQSCYDDTNTKVNPNSPEGSNCVDPIHEGIPCLDDEDCPMSKNCDKTLNLCLCERDEDCNTQLAPGKNTILQQYVCAPPIDPRVGFMTNPNNKSERSMAVARGTRPAGWKKGDYNVCRATRKTMDIGVGDLMIFKDRLDRWVSSRALWNQHAYSIINIEDDGKVPTRKQWLDNWLLKNYNLKIEGTENPRPVYNNYRMNKQGEYGAGTVPDITGRFIAGNICGVTEDGRHVISGKLCNRGTKPVSTKLPASFYYYDVEKEQRGERICTSYTNAILGVGECDQVGCKVDDKEFEKLAGKDVIMITNVDELGVASTVECNANNNTDITHIDSCMTEPIVIIN
ncbi:MAG: VCBS repeat-containing protein [Proteobacteria bacterium]|nr:VCBS repeat-containing protein [Pseudomonadota bacterium]